MTKRESELSLEILCAVTERLVVDTDEDCDTNRTQETFVDG